MTDKPHVTHNSGNNEWYTPSYIIESARRVMGSIDLDPASSEVANTIVRATTFYTEETNGLDKNWSGRAWMNPPYSSKLVSQFTEKMALEFSLGNISEAIVLVNNATETEWFKVLARVASAVVFPSSRVRFLDMSLKPTGAPLQGQAIIYLGENPDKFLKEFRQYGWGATIVPCTITAH